MTTELYTATLKLLGKLHTATGVTPREALENIEVQKGKGMGILTMSKGDKKREVIVPARRVYQMFSASKLMREVAIKQLSMRLEV